MENILYLGDYAYSSWSLRGWLLFEKFGILASVRLVDFHDERSVSDQMAQVAPSRTVPTLVTPDGAVIWDSLAMAEELANRYPDAGIWPAAPARRALARSLAAEMHSSYSALRSECPMNLRTAYADSNPSDGVLADLERIQAIWTHARNICGVDGPWLCGSYSAADVFFAPVAARIAGYSLPVGQRARDYVNARLNDPAFQTWRDWGLEHGETLPWYAKSHPVKDWPTSI